MSLEHVKDLARARWWTATAFRVGVLVGEKNLRIANPYSGKLAKLYREGIRTGRTNRRKREAQ